MATSTILTPCGSAVVRLMTCVAQLLMIVVVLGATSSLHGADGARPSQGETIARMVCSGCHLYPPPDLLDRRTWEVQVLPRMETRLGVSPPDYRSSPEGELLRRLRIYPDAPLIPKADWDRIVEFYLTEAPVEPIPQPPRREIRIGLPQFDFEVVRFRFTPPATTLTAIGPEGRIYLGDERARRIVVIDTQGAVLQSLSIDNVPVSLIDTPAGIYVTGVGSFLPSEIQSGSLIHFPRAGSEFGPRQVLREGLPRAAHSSRGDLNGDGREDFLMCLFGNHRGRLSWLEQGRQGAWTEHSILEKSGAIHSAIRDFNGDGALDLAVLTAQENETFQILTNAGNGTFAAHQVFQWPPTFGNNSFELVDHDGDGVEDLVIANGDNGEFQSPPKRYHGIRIFRGLGNGRFETKHAMFFPLNGAVRTASADFDQDGDVDIAAISYYPDYARSPRESFVYLENDGNGGFEPHTFAQCISGRWLTLAAADLDDDGDLDLVLGSHIRGPTPVPEFLARRWAADGPSVVILRNRARKHAPSRSDGRE